MRQKRSDGRRQGGTSARAGAEFRRHTRRPYPLDVRLPAVLEVVEHGAAVATVARAFGLGTSTVKGWVEAYQLGGVDAIRPEPRQPPPRRPIGPAATQPPGKREAVVAVRREHPEYGTRRIR